MWPIAYAIVRTVKPKASDTPRKPMPKPGNAAASTALPQPPKTSQNVPMNSAIALLLKGIATPFDVVHSTLKLRRLESPQAPEIGCKLKNRLFDVVAVYTVHPGQFIACGGARFLTRVTPLSHLKIWLVTRVTSLSHLKIRLVTRVTSLSHLKIRLVTRVTPLSHLKIRLVTRVTSLSHLKIWLVTRVTPLSHLKIWLVTRVTPLSHLKIWLVT